MFTPDPKAKEFQQAAKGESVPAEKSEAEKEDSTASPIIPVETTKKNGSMNKSTKNTEAMPKLFPKLNKDTLASIKFSTIDNGGEKGVSEEDNPLKEFFRVNELSHLYELFAKLKITENSITALNETSLEQIGVQGEDKKKMLEAIENFRKMKQAALDSINQLDEKQ